MASAAPSHASTPGSIWGGPIALVRQKTNPYNSDVSTAVTISIMRRLARQYASDPLVIHATQQAISGGATSQREIACAIFYWMRSTLMFTEDEDLMYAQLGIPVHDLDKELLIAPPQLLSMAQPMGDCDDYSLLGASMLLAAGIRPYFVTVAADDSEPWKFSHIFLCAEIADEGSHMCLDAGNRMPMVPPGWEPGKVARKAIWRV